MAALSLGSGVHVERGSDIRFEIQHAADHQGDGLFYLKCSTLDCTVSLSALHCQAIRHEASANLLLSPYVVGAISALVNALFADRFTWRMPALAVADGLVLLAFSVLFAKAGQISDNVALCYFFVHVALAGVYPIPPGASAWTANNLGPAKRAAGLAFMTSVGNLGGIIGSFIYMEREAPTYPTGYGTSLAMAAAGMCASFTLDYFYWRINKTRASQSEEEIREKYTDEELEAMDDRSPLFRYNL